MKTGARPPVLAFLLAALAAGPSVPPAAAQDKPAEPAGLDEEPPKPLTPQEEKEARALFAKAMAYVEKGGGIPARKFFEEFLEKYPGADPEMLREADDRSGDNFLAGIELQHDGGPPERRIDVELMGDGYTLDIFKKFKDDAFSQMKEFWKEPLYSEYEDYFNVWRFDLVSKENGVDEQSPEEKGMPPPEEDPKKRKKKKKPKTYKQYSTALDCKAAGPQNQVWANPEQVGRWRQYFKHSDGLTIAFANKGALGMGGGGIATTGKKVAVVHEFGHAFVGLLDEYTGNPERPQGRIFAPNAISTDNPDPRVKPPLDEIPWKHWLVLKPKPPDVDVILGGATYSTGVFRPASGCSMNAGGGGTPYCTVCRETGVLRIYSYLSPLDEYGPIQPRLDMIEGESREFFVQPMAPKTHQLKVDWTLQVIGTSPEQAPPVETPSDGGSYVEDDRAGGMWQREGDRAAERRSNPLPEGMPKGPAQKATVKKIPGGNAFRSTVKMEKLPQGVYLLTARVFDDTKLPGSNFPWVIKDPERLREEWKTWTLVVSAPKASSPPPPSAPPVPPAPGGK